MVLVNNCSVHPIGTVKDTLGRTKVELLEVLATDQNLSISSNWSTVRIQRIAIIELWVSKICIGKNIRLESIILVLDDQLIVSRISLIRTRARHMRWRKPLSIDHLVAKETSNVLLLFISCSPQIDNCTSLYRSS